jgi:hypothetical protein
MARPTDKIRIQNIDPELVAADVDERMDKALSKMIESALLDVSLNISEAPVKLHRSRTSNLAMTGRDLAIFAQQGLCGSLDWEDHSCAADAAHELVSRLYARPVEALQSGSGNVGPLDEALDADLDDPLSLVLVAAWARWELSQGAPLTARQLAAIAGLDPDVVKRMGREGELRFNAERPATVNAKEAKRWLKARGIKGV